MAAATRTTILAVVAILLCATEARAFNFTPTDAEWASWPGFCRAKYAWTQIGRRSKFVHMVSESDRAQLVDWEASGIMGLHHYCAGTLYLNRAMLEESEARRQGLLARTISDWVLS